MVGVLTLIILQAFFYLYGIAVDRINISEDVMFEFVPMLFSLKPFVYSYTLVTATFLHLNLMHLLGNLMFFLAFARTLERLFGTLIFISAYIFIGALAFIGSWLLNPDSVVPIVGSSGAISFLMGVYFVIFPHSKLRLIFTIPPFFKRFWVPAYVYLIFWILLQLYDIFTNTEASSGVAYATHALGFLIGMTCGMTWKELGSDTESKIEKLKEST